MATTPHASLTGADLHEPKGVASAAVNTVYVANGAGSGSWTTYDTYRTTKIVKTSDTSRSSTDTLQADPVLTFAVAINSKYLVRILILGDSQLTPDFKYKIALPASATVSGLWSIRANASGLHGMNTEAFDGSTNSFDTDNDGGRFFMIGEGYVETGGTAGNFDFQWSQNTSNSTPAIVKAGSFIEYQKIA